MGRSVARAWRVCRTGFGYAVLGVLAPLVGSAVFVVARLTRRDRSAREIFVQRQVHLACCGYLRLLEGLGVLRVGSLGSIGADRLRSPGPKLVVANHPTLLDAVVLIAAMPQADCIVNRDRAQNPFLRLLVRECGYVRNDGGLQVVSRCAGRLRQGRSLIVFPEGTRSPVGGMHRFQRGAAHIALVAGCDVVPVAIRCTPSTLAKGQKWYDVPERTFCVTLGVGEPISTSGFERLTTTGSDGRSDGVASPLAARRLTAELRETLAKELDLDL
jgi:1-acyl-sn-glycerol-3-phosphate acyltransferase